MTPLQDDLRRLARLGFSFLLARTAITGVRLAKDAGDDESLAYFQSLLAGSARTVIQELAPPLPPLPPAPPTGEAARQAIAAALIADPSRVTVGEIIAGPGGTWTIAVSVATEQGATLRYRAVFASDHRLTGFQYVGVERQTARNDTPTRANAAPS